MSTDSKHILVIPSWYPPRGGGFFRTHSNALAEAGLNIQVLAAIESGLRKNPASFFSSSNIYSSRYRQIVEYRKMFRRIPLLDKKNVHRWVNHVVSMYESHIQTHGHPDLIQAHSSMWAGLAAAVLRAKYGVPYVLTEHRGRFTGVGRQAKKLIKDWHIPLLRDAFGNAAHIVCVSHALTKTIGPVSPDSLDKIKVIPNMVDTDFFLPAERDGDNSRPFTFACIANLSPEKGLDVLLEAFAQLHNSSGRQVKLIIGGDGPERKKLKRQTAMLGLDDRVVFTGSLSQEGVLQVLHQAHAFVSASYFEAFGIVIIEAMSCGLPVIATRAGGPADIVSHSIGLLCNPGQPEKLASAMQDLMQHHKRYDKKAIRNFCIQHFSKRTIADSYLKLYNQILQK